MKKTSKAKKKKIGQITIKKIGSCFAVCIGGTPYKICGNTPKSAECEAEKLREKYGRRHYPLRKSPRKRKKH